MFEGVEDEVEAVFEGMSEVVADVGDVAGDDFGDVGVLLCERGELLVLCLFLELARLLVRHRCGAVFVFEGDGFLLECVAVDVREACRLLVRREDGVRVRAVRSPPTSGLFSDSKIHRP